MDVTYERVVAAAVAETTSKFKLAEALALDIPPRTAGRPGADADASVEEYLNEAREAIIAAGGEPRTTNTLRDYRLTALWNRGVNASIFRWVPGLSFTSHNEARKAGLSYDELAANPMKTDEIRRSSGKAGTDGQPREIARSWSTDARVEVVREALADPDVADEVIRDPEAKGHVVSAQIRAGQDRIRETAEQREKFMPAELRDANRKLGQRDAQVALGQICDRFAREVSETLPGAGPLAASEKFWLGEARDRAAVALEAVSDYLRAGSTGLSDEDLMRLAGGEPA